MASRKATDPRANRLLGLLSPVTTNGFARIFTVLRWNTDSLSTVLISPSDSSISSRLASAPW